MSTSLANEFQARAVSITPRAERFEVELADGRAISIPYAWFPRLAAATPAERVECELTGRGLGIHWPLVDEDLSVAGLLRGAQ